MTTYDVIIKKVEPQLIASTRSIIPAYPAQGPLWQTLGTHLQQQKTTPSGACFTLYHSDEPEIDAEVCEPLASTVLANDRIKVYELPGFDTMASVVHHGPFTTIGDAYQAIVKWIEANGYRSVGPIREIYLQTPQQDGNQSDPNTVTEIQFPVSRA